MKNFVPLPHQGPSRGFAMVRPFRARHPEENFEAIARRLYAHEFSWDIQRALQFALFRTCAVPSISRLLAQTGEFETRPRKRYDDTELLLAETIEHGLDSPRGKRSIARMNAMRRRFQIANDDMLYVLSTFVCEPIRWLDRFGRRRMTNAEKKAWFLYYRALGARMGIQNMPDDLADLMHWNAEFEAARFRFSDTNRRIGTATRDLLLVFYLPRWLIRVGRPVVHAFLDRPLRESTGFPPAPDWLRRVLWGALRTRANLLRWLPLRRKPRWLTKLPRQTYPEDHRIEELATFRRAAMPSKPPFSCPAKQAPSIEAWLP